MNGSVSWPVFLNVLALLHGLALLHVSALLHGPVILHSQALFHGPVILHSQALLHGPDLLHYLDFLHVPVQMCQHLPGLKPAGLIMIFWNLGTIVCQLGPQV